LHRTSGRSLPFLSRRNYHYELRQIIAWSILAGLVEGNFGSVVVAKSFHGGEWLIAIATATPVAAFLSSLVWGLLCVGRPKLRLLTFFSAGTALCAGAVAAIPESEFGAIWFIAQMAAAQVLMAGVLTVRSALWKSNYPASVRGQVTARLQRARFVVSVLTSLGAAAVCDRDPAAYQTIYPMAAGLGLFAVWMIRRLHVRGERSELRGAGRRPAGNADLRRDLVEPFSLTALLSPGHVLGAMVRVLREDRRFRLYCLAQFLMGIANLMTISIVASLITRELDFGAAWGFWVSTTLLVAIPQLGLLGSIGRWGRLFDRVGVLAFRVINVSVWTGSLVLAMLATLMIVKAEAVGVWVCSLRGRSICGPGLAGGDRTRRWRARVAPGTFAFRTPGAGGNIHGRARVAYRIFEALSHPLVACGYGG